MPDKKGRQSAQEKKFIEAYASSHDAKAAAIIAGYKSSASRTELLQRPAIQEAIRERETMRLFSEALPLAVNTLVEIMADAKAPAGARIQASKVVLDRTLGDEKANGKELEPHEMTAEQIQRRIDELERVAGMRAKPVEAVELDQAPDPFG